MKLEEEIYNFVDLEGKTSPKQYNFVHKASIRPESVNRLSNPRMNSEERSSRATLTPRSKVIKRSNTEKNFGIAYYQKLMVAKNFLEL